MLELHLRSGALVTFDGRIVEVFSGVEPSRRFHIEQLGAPELLERTDGARALVLAHGSVTLPVSGEEAPSCNRLLAAIADAHAALEAADLV